RSTRQPRCSPDVGAPLYPVRLPSRAATPRVRPSFPTRRSSDLLLHRGLLVPVADDVEALDHRDAGLQHRCELTGEERDVFRRDLDRKSTRLNSSHVKTSYAVFCLKKKKYRWRRGRPHPSYSSPC